MSREPRIDLIRQRAELLRRLRRFFDDRGFLEVQPPCLSRDCVVDAYIDPIAVCSGEFRLSLKLPEQFFLQTSPEAAMKRMLAAGAPSIYSLGPVFRAGEYGELHNVEFTMMEWYDVGAGMAQGIELLGTLAVELLDRPGFDVRDYRDVFQTSLGFDPIDGEMDAIQRCLAKVDASLPESIGNDRDGLLDVLLSEVVQPKLGRGRPLIVKNYPLSQAALARVSDEDPHCAARFELFVDGVELANGYDELRDADVLIKRSREHNERRKRAGRTPLHVETGLARAMRVGLPPCSGVALGVDRLLMIIAGEKTLGPVIPFSIETA